MKIKVKITALLGAVIGLFTACSDYDVAPDYSVGENNNAIVLGAGVAEGGNGVMSRAVDGNHAGNASGGAHKTLAEGTKMTLRVDGTWLGKADNYALPHGKVTSQVASQTTTATVGSAFKGQNTDENNTHNEVSMNPQLYWDDYGTADPANMSPNTGNGRDKGLTIYGAAVDDATVTYAPTVSDWTALQWSLPSDQTNGWTAEDLITSNNITATADGTYKFDALKPASTLELSNLLEFTHAMSKITVELTAGEGFDGYATDPATAKFKNAPTVTLLGFNYIGKVDIVNKNSTATQADYSATDASNPAATDDFKTWRDKGVAWTTGGQHTSTFDAIVFPGNKFTATIGTAPEYKPTSTDQLLELNADGNIYKVTAGELVKAIKGTGTTGTPVDATIEQGYNYLIKITVNKTKIEKIEATIVDWKTYETEGQIIPKINVTASYGEAMTSTNTFTHDFEFFRSLSKDQKYSKDATVTHTENAGVHSYTLSTPLYWPDHATHYFFRGVYPLIGTESGQIPVDKVSASATEKQKEYIAVENVRYAADTYPSGLAIGYPRTTSDKCTHNNDVAENGICATEGTITMNFEYAMSQVEVKLSTTEDTDDSHVIIDENTVIKIVGGYSAANILLKDGNASFTSISKADWTMPINGTDYANRHDAIVPQTLGDMKFSVTVKNSNDTYDTYECKIADIQVKEKLSYGTYGALTSITKWEPGKKYVYELKLKKTAITAVATITPWTEVKAEENIWF